MLIPTLKSSLRRILWVGRNLFLTQGLPVLTSAITRAGTDAVKARLPKTTSPSILTHLVSQRTIDGARLGGYATANAWAKYAIPKGLPAPGTKSLAIENDPHTVDDFSGEIAHGYGKGRKVLLLSGPVTYKISGKTRVGKINYHVHEADKAGTHYDLVVEGVPPGTKQWEVNIPNGQFKGRYAFITTGQGMLITPMKDQGIQIPKPAYTLRQEERLTEIDPAKVIAERKIDGSLGNAHIQGQRVAFRSHRDGGETYYDRLPAVEFLNNESPFVISRLAYPGPALSGSVFQGELAHPDGSARISGILNSLPANARSIQRQRGPIKYFVWDILKYKGRDISKVPYSERRDLYKRAVDEIRRVNKNWDVVDSMEASETLKEFYDRVTKDPLPYGEGIVVKPRDQAIQKWDKLKMTGFGYFKLVDVLPGEGKYADSVGRLVVENPENGARGEVGSLSVPNEFRNWVWAHRADLIGQTVKVRSQEVTARGVPRAGVFYGFHNGEVDLLMQAESMASGSNRSPKEVMYAMKSAAGWRKK